MYSLSNVLPVLTILESIEKITFYMRDIESADDFFQRDHQIYFHASTYLLLVIGEEAKIIEPNLRDVAPQIPWKQVIGMRNFLAHEYRGIDYEFVYETIVQDLSELKTATVTIANALLQAGIPIDEALDLSYFPHIQYLRTKLPD
jgi:uncharacterized protein with HEPN domain